MTTRIKLHCTVLLVLLLCYPGISYSGKTARDDGEAASVVIGRFAGHKIAEAGEIYISNWESKEWRFNALKIYNVDTKKNRRINLSGQGYFRMELEKGHYQVRVRKTQLEARKTGSKYSIWSDFQVQKGTMVNLGTFKILTSGAKLSHRGMETTYLIQHAEDHEAYRDPVDWIMEKDPELFEIYKDNVVTPFPHGPGNPLYEKSADPEKLMAEMFGLLPGCSLEKVYKAYSEKNETLRKAGTGEDEILYGINHFTNLGLFWERLTPLIFTHKADKVTTISLIIFNSDKNDTAASGQMRIYRELSARLTESLGNGTSNIIGKVKSPEKRLEGLKKGKIIYVSEWNYDVYRMTLYIGGKEIPEDLRDSIQLSVLFMPALIK